MLSESIVARASAACASNATTASVATNKRAAVLEDLHAALVECGRQRLQHERALGLLVRAAETSGTPDHLYRRMAFHGRCTALCRRIEQGLVESVHFIDWQE